MHVELQAACSALGYQEGKLYVKEPDCVETVKDLIRFLKREDETCDIRRELGHTQIVQNDLLPILKQYKDEAVLWETVIRLLVNLSQPGVLCFNGSIPGDKTLRNHYLEIEADLQALKEAFIDEEIFAVLTGKLGDLLKLDWEHRQEEDRLLIERLLILIRNILHVPPNPDAEQRTDDDASVHDQVLWAMHVSGLEDILLYIASSDEERNLSMHILEIVSLMFREQTPDMLASAGVQRSVTEKEKDERELEMARDQERLQKKANLMKHSTRHSRFGGTFVVKNFKSISNSDLIYHKSQKDVADINLDMNKKPKKKAKNRKPLTDRDVVRRSTLSIRLGLKEFCVQFLENCYNPLMYAVKDVLNRASTQEHDETYYLWSIRFFMEFCRLHSQQVDLVSETLSVQAFHYIQIQLFQYYEMQAMEKKEAIVWGKRVHLALKAYQELLLTLDCMDRSGNHTLTESSKVIKSNIFYTMEFRDIFVTLLRHFNESRQSRSYLRDLVETTHLFLKMLENFGKKTGHLVVQKKKKKIIRKKKKPQQQGTTEMTDQQLEDLWDDVSSELSAIFQGRSEVPDSVAPFDAASEIDVDQQRADAMIRVQDSLRNKQPGEGVALFRAAREVWPERNEFGSVDITPEEEFMALREVFMTNIPRPSNDIPGEPEDVYEEEDEDEEVEATVTSEQEFVFRDFLAKFVKPEILKAYVLLLADFQKNTSHTNHCCIKMLHRVAVDLGYIGMMFQACLFRVFQKILLSPLAKAQRYKEIGKFATFVVRRFVEVAENNRKVFVEMLFWKTSKDAIEIIEGYGSYQGKAKMMWTEDAEMEVRRLFEDYKDQDTEGKDAVDCIMEGITDPSKTRGQIIRELKKQELITSAKELKKPKTGSRAGPWREEDELELQQLYDTHKDASDPVGLIQNDMCKPRSRNKVMEKLLSMGLVHDRKDLYKKRGSKSGGDKVRRSHRGGSDSDDLDELPSDYEEGGLRPLSSDDARRSESGSDSGSDSGDEGPGDPGASQGVTTMVDVINGIVQKGYKQQIAWIQRGLTRTADDREEEDDFVNVPIVPLTEENETAMEDQVFLSFLTNIGLACPSNEQEIFWRIPTNLSVLDLRNIVDGLTLDDNDVPVNAHNITMKTADKPRKKKEKKKKPREAMKKKNASKIAALKDLVKKQSDAKKNKRERKKAPVSRDSSDDEAGSQTPVKHIEDGSQDRQSSTKKKRRVKKFVPSDSDDSDEDVPLSRIGTSTQNQSEFDDTPGNQSDTGAGNQSDIDQSESQTSQPLLFLSSSDESDQESGTKKSPRVPKVTSIQSDDDNSRPESQSSKRSRSVGSGSEVEDTQPKKNSKKVAALKDLVKKQSNAKKNKREQKKAPVSRDSSDDEAGSQTPVKHTEDGSQDRQSSTKKKRRVKKFVPSDSDDSDDDVPLSRIGTSTQNQSEFDDTPGNQSDMGAGNQSDIDQSESQTSQPLLFLSSSDESDQESGTKKSPRVPKVTNIQSDDDNSRPESQSSKRSRSVGSGSEVEDTQPKKKAKIVDSDDSDSGDDRPLSSVREETFPATLYTQGPESDSDLDDHVPLCRVIQKKNIIESDDDDE